MDWTETNSYIKGINNHLDEIHLPIRIASFDLDDTLIHSPKHKKSSTKWELVDEKIINKIKQLVTNNYIIIIFTNQAGMGTRKNFNKLKWIKAINALIDTLTSKISGDKYYFAIYVAKNYDLYRKPNIGMWDLMKFNIKEQFNLSKLQISKKSFFCGDAAGRICPSPFKKKLHPTSPLGDFSDSDRKFALNIGIKFLTPEDFYLTDIPDMPYQLHGVDPKKLISQIDSLNEKYVFKPRKKEMIVMIGIPGSGKTEFVKKYILPHGYVHINQDKCKTKLKCTNETLKAAKEEKSIVIDNTNPDVLSRMHYTLIARDHRYDHIRAIIINTNIDIAKHLNNVRHVYSHGKIPKINDITYHIFKKNYVKPQTSEYFDKIETVNFAFDPKYLEDAYWKKVFMRFS